jgi:GNAT superfamily N-acetyltransferase
MSDKSARLRQRARLMLDLSAPRDALAAYYSLYHDPDRTQLFVEEDDHVQGFLAICQTGHDLFRPFAVLRARKLTAAKALLLRGLQPNRPYYLITTSDLQPLVEQVLGTRQMKLNRVYRLALNRYNPSVNVLVVQTDAPDGSARFVIRSQGQTRAESGINWRSPHFSELYVNVIPEARGRGWGRAVLESCIAWVIRSGAQPLYVVSETNARSIRLAESVGFIDTLAREFAAEVVLELSEGDE